MLSSEEESHAPSWLSEDYDEKHREETAPLLFGDGKLNLQDPEEPSESSKPDYGSSSLKKSQSTDASDDNGDKDDADDDENDDEKTDKPATSKKSRMDKPLKPQLSPRSMLALRAKPHMPQINPCLWLFHFLQGLSIVACLMLVTTQMIPLVFARGNVVAEIGLTSVVLKCYIGAFCVAFILVESDLPIPFLLSSNLLQKYFSRGFLYSFVGNICVQEAYSERIRDIVHKGTSTNLEVSWATIFMQLSSWLMLGVGVVYMLLGLCCLQGVRDRMKEREKEEWREYRLLMKEWNDLYGK